MTEPDFDPSEIELGRWLFAQESMFADAAASRDSLPDAELPEVAFAGRSNVGKSTLVNALTGRKALARTSRTPGRTRQINFFQLGHYLMLADLPGYGYARASKSEISSWTALIYAYLRGRPTLRRVCLLVDARRGLGKADESVMQSLDEAAVSYQIVLTKTDKVRQEEMHRVKTRLAGQLAVRPAAHPRIVQTSAAKLLGIEELRADLASLLTIAKQVDSSAEGKNLQ